jgi:hypothetical protein
VNSSKKTSSPSNAFPVRWSSFQAASKPGS